MNLFVGAGSPEGQSCMFSPLQAQSSVAVFGSFVLADVAGVPTVLTNRWILIEDNRIAAVTRDRPDGTNVVLDRPGMFILPGLLNLHNHCFSEMLARSNTEDGAARRGNSSIIHTVLLPLSRTGITLLSSRQRLAIARLGILGLLIGGSTTVMEPFRAGISEMFDAAEEMGLRFYGAPYLFSTAVPGASGCDVDLKAGDDDDGASDLANWNDLYAKWEGRDRGRVRLAMSPHATDTCHPDLLRSVRSRALELDVPVTIHAAQSQAEVDLCRTRHGGRSPIQYLDWVGMLPDLLAAHCVYSDADDLHLMASRGATVVNCPRVFVRSGTPASYANFRAHGVRTIIGTDGYNLDLLGELNAAAIISKTQSRKMDAASSPDLIAAVTSDAAAAIKRPDLGTIKAGALADLTILNMAHPHLQPFVDPVRALVALGNRSNVDTVIVDGRILVHGGQAVGVDQQSIIEEGAAAIQKIWDLPEAQAAFAN